MGRKKIFFRKMKYLYRYLSIILSMNKYLTIVYLYRTVNETVDKKLYNIILHQNIDIDMLL